MAEEILPPEHRRDFPDRFFLHRRSGAPAVESVIIRIDPHRERIGQACYRMWRLEHLPGVERVEVGIVVLEAIGGGR